MKCVFDRLTLPNEATRAFHDFTEGICIGVLDKGI